MKEFIKRHPFIGAVVGLVLGAILAGSAVFASTSPWSSTSLGVSVSGTINITSPAPTNTYTYTIPSPTAVFSPLNINTGVPIHDVSANITINNTGNQVFTSLSGVITTLPTGLTGVAMTVMPVSYATDGSVSSFCIILDAPAQTVPATINLSTMSISVTPQP